jgi:uncharacterized membrane protein
MWWVVFALHILMATLWVGGMFFALAVLRPSLAVLSPADRLTFHAQVFRRFALVIWHAMPITLATGYALLFGVYGGFRGTHWTIHLMHLTGLLMGGVYLALFFGPYRRFRAQPSAEAVRGIRNLMGINLVLGLLTIALAGAHRYGL